ncbi:ABC transporter ATP-binding protein [Desulfospira joergensenii]|uniref:ABC transporter ATP-binding protein n=1 Tax=Desulfospira joergensenii TaxID=53329 RepID=UPI0003B43A6E|nr:oligopeptide/dipeptide ABC transporter ATP-binding protein [Desulfospira joergensenii]
MKKYLLQVEGLTIRYNTGGRQNTEAISDVGFTLTRGETLGLVGESGCGKSTLARAIMQLPGPASGRILFTGEDLTQVSKKRLKRLRPRFQMIFQDSISSLNPRRKIIDILTAPLDAIGKMSREEKKRRALEMMVSVGIDPGTCHLRPFQFSGGQCQRIQIARALMPEPELLICDEPVSSLDVSVQAQIINLLEALRKSHGLTMLFISHDLAVVKNVCDRVAVMYLGKLCEEAPSEKLYKTHHHPYTRALLSAIPNPDPGLLPSRVKIRAGETPSPVDPPSGCRFRTRCPRAEKHCAQKEPEFHEIEPGHRVACHFPIL